MRKNIVPNSCVDDRLKAQIMTHQGIPFDVGIDVGIDVRVPNEETIRALNEDISKAKSYTDLDEMFADLASED